MLLCNRKRSSALHHRPLSLMLRPHPLRDCGIQAMTLMAMITRRAPVCWTIVLGFVLYQEKPHMHEMGIIAQCPDTVFTSFRRRQQRHETTAATWPPSTRVCSPSPQARSGKLCAPALT